MMEETIFARIFKQRLYVTATADGARTEHAGSLAEVSEALAHVPAITAVTAYPSVAIDCGGGSMDADGWAARILAACLRREVERARRADERRAEARAIRVDVAGLSQPGHVLLPTYAASPALAPDAFGEAWTLLSAAEDMTAWLNGDWAMGGSTVHYWASLRRARENAAALPANLLPVERPAT
jgi:hypothetical protein